MGLVIPFRRKDEYPRLAEEIDLLGRLRGSVQVMWRGGWAVPGDFSGVVLLRNQRCLGVWSYEGIEFVYRPIETGEPRIRVGSSEQAYRHSLLELGDLRPLEEG
ncbi:MAG: hypothetical protein AB7E81_04685 [Hyphomicrobiaceae bacterium]|jgi:hypothetical protein